MTTDKTPATLATAKHGFTTGHCQHNSRPGGCQLHNLQCGWPNCDRRAVEPSLATAKHGGCVQLGDGLAIEKRAREMLADQIETIQGYALAAQELRDGVALDGYSMLPAALSAIIAALSAHPFRDGQRDDSDLLAELRDVEEYLYYGGSNPIHTATVRAAINALSTQPSPGGQGDERSQFEEYRGGDCERDAQGYYTNARTAQDWAMWQAALAARQPVGEPVAYTDGNEFVCVAEYATMRGLGHDGNGWRPLYDGPPAKAVDLGLQLDRYDAGLLGDGGGGDVTWWQDYIRAELNRAHEFYQDQADAHG